MPAICVDSFGMQHDTPENGCESRTGELQHVMSPQMTAEASPLIWSDCSRNAITVFLELVPLNVHADLISSALTSDALQVFKHMYDKYSCATQSKIVGPLYANMNWIQVTSQHKTVIYFVLS